MASEVSSSQDIAPSQSVLRCRAVAPTNPSTFSILALIPDLQHVIFDHLDPVTSACLGLTCKSLYKIHRKHHSRIPLTMSSSPSRFDNLAALLVEWMGPQLRFSGQSGVFVNLERWEKEHMKFGGSRPDPWSFLHGRTLEAHLEETTQTALAEMQTLMDVQFEAAFAALETRQIPRLEAAFAQMQTQMRASFDDLSALMETMLDANPRAVHNLVSSQATEVDAQLESGDAGLTEDDADVDEP